MFIRKISCRTKTKVNRVCTNKIETVKLNTLHTSGRRRCSSELATDGALQWEAAGSHLPRVRIPTHRRGWSRECKAHVMGVHCLEVKGLSAPAQLTWLSG